MKTQRKNTNSARVTAVGLLLSLSSLLVVPASAQINSRGASVALVATLPESVTVQHYTVAMAQSFAGGETATFEAVHVFLQWQLRPGQSVQIQPTLENESQTRSLVSASSEFMSIKELALASHIFAFQLPVKGRAVLLGAVTEGEEKPVGRASLLIGATHTRTADSRTIRISVAVL